MNDSRSSIPSALLCSEARFRYAETTADILHLSGLTVPQGQFISLLGASGSGKSTLLRLVAGLLQPTAGMVECSCEQKGMVFQSPNLVPWRSARHNVQLPAELGSVPTCIEADTMNELFSLVGLSKDDMRKRPAELSGGMQMRVALARALVLRPAMLLMDEPFAALDDLLRMQLEEDVRRIHNERSLTTVLVTHNIHEAIFMSDRVLILGGTPSIIHADVNITLPPDRTGTLRTDKRFHHLVSQVTHELHAAAAGAIA